MNDRRTNLSVPIQYRGEESANDVDMNYDDRAASPQRWGHGIVGTVVIIDVIASAVLADVAVAAPHAKTQATIFSVQKGVEAYPSCLYIPKYILWCIRN